MAKNKFYAAKVNVNQNIFSSDEMLSEIIQIRIPEQILKFTDQYVSKFYIEKSPEKKEKINKLKLIKIA